MESKLYICGITSYETEKIKELIENTKDYFDGFVWCVDSSENSDETYKLLEENKKEGKIVRHRWTNNFDFQMNEWLYSGDLKEGDWCYIADSSSYPTKFWMEQMRNQVKDLEKNSIQAVYASNCPFLFRFTDYLWFLYSPHWSLQGIHGKIVNIPDDEKSKYIYNARLNDEKSKSKHFQEHDTRNYITYGRNNQIQAFYGKYGNEIVGYHENCRIWFRSHLKMLGYEPNLKGLEEYYRKGEFSEQAIKIIDQEFCLSEYYRRTVLKEDFMKDIVPRRELWSFKNHINHGDGFYNKDYLGTRPRYDFEIFSQKSL